MFNLVMAICWLILGIILLAWQWSDLTGHSLSIWGTGIQLGWFAVAMALYNLLRWWLARSSRKASPLHLAQVPLRRARDPNAERTQAAPTRDLRFGFTKDEPSRDDV